MKIEIWSDVICPYCYMGKRALEAALEKYPEKSTVEIIWHSYLLDPSLEAEKKIDFYQYMADLECISYEDAVKERKKVEERALTFGLVYNFDKAVLTSTFDAHRLIHLAGKYKLGSAAEEALFKSYFTDGLDISNKDVLLSIGKQIGLNEIEVVDMLESSTFSDEISADIQAAEQLNLYYVPFFLFEGKHVVTGVVTEDDFLKVLNNIDTDSAPEYIQGQSCNLDGTCH